MKTCGLVFPNQLFDRNPALGRGQVPVLVEDSLFWGDDVYPVRFHVQKLILHRASMKAYADRLKARGQVPRYVTYEAGRQIGDVIRQLACEGCAHMDVTDPVDDVLEKRVRRACREAGVGLTVHPTPMFLTPPEWGGEVVGSEPPFRLTPFYVAQRKRLGILLEAGGKPTGGKWTFDTENRKKWPKNQIAPALAQVEPGRWAAAAIRQIQNEFPEHPGEAHAFNYPVTHEAAVDWLDDFLALRLPGFGTYEDAMSRRHPVLHHSVLTPMLNIGLLTPDQVVQRVLSHAHERAIPLNDVEGFIRQVIGWREFMMCMYRTIGRRQRTSNFWGHTRRMPFCFYEGTTGILPVDHLIHQLHDRAYTHHIERLMVLGNFMLLCEIRPHDVYQWFMEYFIDAYDWVMVPNVYGMSQFADGGWLCTKPYISSSNYIRKMSDFPVGPWCATWDGLFWRFIDKHAAFFAGQPRLSMMARQWERMDRGKRRRHLEAAETYLSTLG